MGRSDPTQRLHRMIVRTDADDVDFDYYYNTAWQVLEVRKAGVAAYPHKQYVWDLRYIDAPICRIRDVDTDGQVLENG